MYVTRENTLGYFDERRQVKVLEINKKTLNVYITLPWKRLLLLNWH